MRWGGLCTEIVSGQDDAVGVFHGKDTCAHNLGLLGMCRGGDRGVCGAMEGRLDRLHRVHVHGQHRRGMVLEQWHDQRLRKADAAMALDRARALRIHS